MDIYTVSWWVAGPHMVSRGLGRRFENELNDGLLALTYNMKEILSFDAVVSI